MRRVKGQDGVSWQIIPVILFELLNDSDKQKSQKVMKAMLQMKKIDISELKRAYAQSDLIKSWALAGHSVSSCW
jgi:hypothetical protein